MAREYEHKHRQIVCEGKQGSGKDSKTDTIVAHVQAVYGRKNVCFHKANGEDFHQILNAKDWPRKPIIIINLQDCSNVKFKEDPEIREFWRIRHVAQQKTGLSQGLALGIMTTHSWFRFQKEFRTDTDAILISDLPTDEYDKREYCRRFIPDLKDQERLKRVGLRKVREPAWKGYAYAVGIGFIYLPRVPTITPDRTYTAKPAWTPKPESEKPEKPSGGRLGIFRRKKDEATPVREYTGPLAMRFKRIAIALTLFVLVTVAGWTFIDNRASLTPYPLLFLAVLVLIFSRKTLWGSQPKKA